MIPSGHRINTNSSDHIAASDYASVSVAAAVHRDFKALLACMKSGYYVPPRNEASVLVSTGINPLVDNNVVLEPRIISPADVSEFSGTNFSTGFERLLYLLLEPWQRGLQNTVLSRYRSQTSPIMVFNFSMVLSWLSYLPPQLKIPLSSMLNS